MTLKECELKRKCTKIKAPDHLCYKIDRLTVPGSSSKTGYLFKSEQQLNVLDNLEWAQESKKRALSDQLTFYKIYLELWLGSMVLFYVEFVQVMLFPCISTVSGKSTKSSSVGTNRSGWHHVDHSFCRNWQDFIFWFVWMLHAGFIMHKMVCLFLACLVVWLFPGTVKVYMSGLICGYCARHVLYCNILGIIVELLRDVEYLTPANLRKFSKQPSTFQTDNIFLHRLWTQSSPHLTLQPLLLSTLSGSFCFPPGIFGCSCNPFRRWLILFEGLLNLQLIFSTTSIIL